ncbi:MAG: quinone-dependent dihydroorotate dehydrogenase [Verrucomicrobiota bacterium]
MTWVYRTFVRPSLFAQDSESIHNFTLKTLGTVSRHRLFCEVLAAFFAAPPLPVKLWGLSFPNPVGLAAGMDKEAEAVPAWRALGFGFSELGAVTWHPQPGNPIPRVFRAIPDSALVNRMGFNNHGAEAMAAALAKWRIEGYWPDHPVGINLGKSKITPLERAAEDYAASFEVLWPHLDFFVVNVSSPNTPNLRQLQDRGALDEILGALQNLNTKLALAASESLASNGPSMAHQAKPEPTPILVKIAPDLAFEAIDEILELAPVRGIAGLVATNTTLARPEPQDPRLRSIYAEAGGLSGKPLQARSTQIIRHIYRQTQGRLPIIGVGGIFNAADAWEKIRAGASLLQVYTGLVYEGPGVARGIVSGLLDQLEAAALPSLEQAVGCDAKPK